MSKRRRSKALEKVARAIKDSDEFVEHVCNIARGYETQHELDSGPRNRAVRQSLKAFQKHASALALWLDNASKVRGSPVEQEALSAISMAMHGSPIAVGADAIATRLWLERAIDASTQAEQGLQGKRQQNAPRLAAEALRATFEHHKLKVSYQATEKKQSDAVRLLCAIAKDAGDTSITPVQAKDWLVQSTARAVR